MWAVTSAPAAPTTNSARPDHPSGGDNARITSGGANAGITDAKHTGHCGHAQRRRQERAVAEDQLRKLGFTRIQFGSQDRNDRVVLLPSSWTVTKQSANAGESVTTDTLIVLTCTKQQ